MWTAVNCPCPCHPPIVLSTQAKRQHLPQTTRQQSRFRGLLGKPGPLIIVSQPMLVTTNGDFHGGKGSGAFPSSILRFGAPRSCFFRLSVVASKSIFSCNFHGKVCSLDAVEEVWNGCFDGSLHVVDLDCSEEMPSLEGAKVL